MDPTVMSVRMAHARSRILAGASKLATEHDVAEPLARLEAAHLVREPQLRSLRQMEAIAEILAVVAGLPAPEPETGLISDALPPDTETQDADGTDGEPGDEAPDEPADPELEAEPEPGEIPTKRSRARKPRKTAKK